MHVTQQQSLNCDSHSRFFEAFTDGTGFCGLTLLTLPTGKLRISRYWYIGAAKTDQIVPGMLNDGNPDPFGCHVSRLLIRGNTGLPHERRTGAPLGCSRLMERAFCRPPACSIGELSFC